MDNKSNSDLSPIRSKINDIDNEIISLLSKRKELSKEIVKAKQQKQLPIKDYDRENELLNRLVELGKSKGLNAVFIQRVYNEIIQDSIDLQENYHRQRTK